MRKRRLHIHITLMLIAALAGMWGVSGCRKEPASPSPEQAEQQAAFQNSPGTVTCSLKKAKLDDVDLPENPPYFIRDMQRNSVDTLLRGELTIGDKDFVVLLPTDQARGMGQAMALYEASARRTPYWWGADEINSVHPINGRFYEFAVLGGRTQFAARPYTGKTGLIKVGKADRQIQKAAFQGSIRSNTYVVPVGDLDENGWPQAAAEYSVPVGDYRPAIMTVTYDNLTVSISDNYHRDAEGRPMGQRPRVYGFTVREDAPYVLDFSNEPVVVFDTPAPDQDRFKAGEEIKFAAVLVDPKLDIMIRGLRDTAVDVEQEYTDAAGNKRSYTTKKSLDPTVTIARADGEVVAEGVMPFG